VSTRWREVDYTSCFLMEAGLARQKETPATVETAEGWAIAKSPAAPGSPASVHSNELTSLFWAFPGAITGRSRAYDCEDLYEDSVFAILHARWPDRFPA
jgi:hypothetical protein